MTALHPSTVASLERIYKRWAVAHVCSECGNPPGSMDPKTPHALQPELDRLDERTDLTPAQRKLVHLNIERAMHHSSRCCGAQLTLTYCDYYQMLYDGWCQRTTSPIRRQLDSDIRSNQTDVMLHSLRTRYGDQAKHHDDDFIMMWAIWGVSDTITGQLINIFREEDRLRAEAAAHPALVAQTPSSKEALLTVEEDFLQWIQNW